MIQDMSTTYGYTKQVESNQQGSSLTLASLMSKLRSRLGAAWEQARSRLEYAYSMLMTTFLRPFSSKRAELERRLVSDEITARPSRDYGSSVTILRLVVSMLLLLIVGTGNVWGQTDYSGTYYIGTVTHSTESTTNNFYLCPTEEYYYYQSTSPYYTNEDNDMPFLTTYKCRSTEGYDERKALWVIEKHPSLDCYYIKHAIDGKYLTYNAGFFSNKGRVRFHLEDSPSNNDYALFFINYYPATSSYEIISKYASDNNIDPDSGKPRKYLNINKGNQQSLTGTDADKTSPFYSGGLIGLWTSGNSESSGSGRFYLEKAKCKTPVITYDNVTSKVTITSDNDETIYYTTAESNPDANSNVYTAPFELTEGKVIKAISKKTNLIDSEIATLTVVKLATPVITFNEETREVTITAAEGAMIYYTTNDTDPTIGETTAHAASPVVIAHALPSTKIHAQAVKSGSINSDIATKTDIPAKVLTNPTIILAEDEFIYDGSAKQPAITVKDGDNDISADEYVVTYSNNTNAGTASVTISDNADGDYQVNDGSKNFTISPKSLGDGTTAAGGITVEMTEDGSLSAVKDGSTTLVENTDYTQETVEEGSDKIITITGMGNYTGSVKALFANPVFTDPDGTGSEKAAAVYTASRDLSAPAGIEPYIVRKVNPSIGTLVISKLDYIPEDVPVLLLSNAESEGFVASPKDPSIPEVTVQTKNSNQLKVSQGGETVEAAQIYMFYKGEFVLTKAGTLGKGKYYLYNPNFKVTPSEDEDEEEAGENPAGSRGVLRIVFEDETTGIDDLKNEKTEERKLTGWYSLDGRRLSGKPTKGGIYIHKGQKIYIKR